MTQTKPSPRLIAALTFLPLISAFGWSEPHLAITKAALEVLAPWQKDLLGPEGTRLGDDYCLIPDHVFTDKPNAKFATMESKPGEVYIQTLHLPSPQQADNLETLRYFMGKAVSSIQAKKIDEAARYMGTLCHVLEDFGSPSHTVPGDNMFTLLQQFLPPTDAMKDQLLHGPIESGEIKVVIKDYQPTLLGTTVDEAAWRLLHRLHEGIINARSTTIPIIQALYAEDHETVVTQQLKAATLDAKVVADALHTILSLGAQKLEATAQAKTSHRRYRLVLAHGSPELVLPSDAILRLTLLGAREKRSRARRREESSAHQTAHRGQGRTNLHQRHQRRHGEDADLPSSKGCLSSLHCLGWIAVRSWGERPS